MSDPTPTLRIGQGLDIHRFSDRPERPLEGGGVGHQPVEDIADGQGRGGLLQPGPAAGHDVVDRGDGGAAGHEYRCSRNGSPYMW